jgi:ubiquitin C-terminal hydrolase
MVGLRNLGHTCFINSVIQVLFGIEPFREAIISLSSMCHVIHFFQLPSDDATLLRDLRKHHKLRHENIRDNLISCLSTALYVHLVRFVEVSP